MSADDGKKKARAAVQAAFDRYKLLALERPKDHIDFDGVVMNGLKLIDAGPEGSVEFELYIGKNFSNLNDIMHGGAAGVIFDMSTTLAICPLARPGSWEFMSGLSRSLNISYLKGVPIGTTVRLVSRVVNIGKRMALVRGEMTSLDGKTTFCTAEHHKVNNPPLPSHMSKRIPWDDEFEKEWGVVKGKTEIGLKSKI